MEEVQKWQIPVEKKILSFEATNKINRLFEQFSSKPDNASLLEDIGRILLLVETIDLDPSLNKLQNQLLQMSREYSGDWSKSKDPKNLGYGEP